MVVHAPNGLVLYMHAFDQVRVISGRDDAVGQDVLAAVIRRDEPDALVVVPGSMQLVYMHTYT